jgi:hypothetical protein
LTSFHDFGLAEPITRALAEEKYATPTRSKRRPFPSFCRAAIGLPP